MRRWLGGLTFSLWFLTLSVSLPHQEWIYHPLFVVDMFQTSSWQWFMEPIQWTEKQTRISRAKSHLRGNITDMQCFYKAMTNLTPPSPLPQTHTQWTSKRCPHFKISFWTCCLSWGAAQETNNFVSRSCLMEGKQVICTHAFLFGLFCRGRGENSVPSFDLPLHVCACPQGSIEERLKQLQDAHRDFGPGSQHFLSSKSPFSASLFEAVASSCTVCMFLG